MPLIEKLKNALKNDWLISSGLFLIFLATNGYTYAWDDQHLEIPLLKSLIDPSLYVGDYYVEALKQNFTSFLYPILAKFITVQQIPSVYFVLYLASRFTLFFYAYKLWKWITKDIMTAALCVLSFFLIFRVEEFLYRTFSHQEFALGIIMAGMYYFYKNRYSCAAILFGLAVNFHALYSLFPFCFMLLYLLQQGREDRGKKLLVSIGLFAICSLPLAIWTFKRLFVHPPTDPQVYHNWINLYYLACPATFPFDSVRLQELFSNFSIFSKGTRQFWPIIALYLFNRIHNSSFRNDLKTQAILAGGTILIIISLIFSYIFPTRFVLDLNLIRNLQFMQFILIGYTTFFIVRKITLINKTPDVSGSTTITTKQLAIGVIALILYSLLRFNSEIAALAVLAMFFLLNNKNGLIKILALGMLILSLIMIGFQFQNHHFNHAAMLAQYAIIITTILIFLLLLLLKNDRLKKILILLPFSILVINNIYYHKIRINVERSAGGFWQLQRNWIDMQNYVRTHTAKNALILTPNDMEMGGFRIFSERKVVVCYRDCGIIGFDYLAVLQWQKRLKDIEHFKVIVDGDIQPALINAIRDYKVNYIVFMRYLNPERSSFLVPVYQNETFALYRVSINSEK